MVRGEGVRRWGAELAGSQEAIEGRAECRPKYALVVKGGGGGVVQSLFELAKNVNGDRKSCSRGGGLGVLDTLDDLLQESVSGGVSIAILYVQ